MNIELITIRGNGTLFYMEAERDISFPIMRVYYISGEKADAHRGFHAHKSLKQVLFCPYGKINILLNNGREKVEVLLDDPQKGLVLGNEIVWREMVWQEKDSVLCVLASDYYDEDDYIRDYKQFLEYVGGHRYASRI